MIGRGLAEDGEVNGLQEGDQVFALAGREQVPIAGNRARA